MPQLGKYVSPPGEKVFILAISEDLATCEILDGYKREGALAVNGIDQKGFNLTDSTAMIYKKKGKPVGIIHPCIYEIASGVRFLGMGKAKIPPENPGRVDKILMGMSSEVRAAMLKRPVQFKVAAETLVLKTDPRLIGKALDNALMKNVLSLRSEIWQLIVALLFGLLVGIVIM